MQLLLRHQHSLPCLCCCEQSLTSVDCNADCFEFKAVVLQMFNNEKKNMKLTLNPGQVMLNEESFIIDPFKSQLTKSFVKHRFSLHNLLCY